jgi:hypothetical protein
VWVRRGFAGEWIVVDDGPDGSGRVVLGPKVSTETVRAVRLGLPGRVGVEHSHLDDAHDPMFADETLGTLLTTAAKSAAGTAGRTMADAAASAVRKAIAARRKAKEDDWREERGRP